MLSLMKSATSVRPKIPENRVWEITVLLQKCHLLGGWRNSFNKVVKILINVRQFYVNAINQSVGGRNETHFAFMMRNKIIMQMRAKWPINVKYMAWCIIWQQPCWVGMCSTAMWWAAWHRQCWGGWWKRNAQLSFPQRTCWTLWSQSEKTEKIRHICNPESWKLNASKSMFTSIESISFLKG